jgi:hypothetical protein
MAPARQEELIMLSFIYKLVSDFEQRHGIRPNLLYLSEVHAIHLKDGFSDEYDLKQITDMLGMEIIIDRGVIHPHVAWTRLYESQAAVS